MKYTVFVSIFVLSLCAAMSVLGQEDVLTLVPFDGSEETFLNVQIAADIAANDGLLPDRVYELQRDAVYLNRAEMTITENAMRLRAEEGSGTIPIIYQWETGTGDNPTRPPGNFIRLNGADLLEIKDIAIVGYYEPQPERLDGVQGNLIRTDAAGSSIVIEGVVFSNISGQFIRAQFDIVTLKVTNTIFANMGALTTSNLGAGKGIDLRESTIDNLILQNNTFVNYQDRPIRHYNFGNPQQGTGPIRYGLIEHNSFINGMGYHGLLSLGNVGDDMIIRNNLFVDAFALGEDPTDATRAAEWANTGEVYENGNNKITWIFSAPNEVTQWTVSNNYYNNTDAGWAFLNANGFGPADPLSDHIKERLAAQGGNPETAFQEVNLTLANTPDLMTNMLNWYVDPNGANKTKETDTFDPGLHDFDRRDVGYFLGDFDASYGTDSPAYTGSTDGFPVGDLNWFPDKKAEWEIITNVEDEPRHSIPASITLNQNYPNPFNPSTIITYAISERAQVTLEVFDILGRHVSTLVNNVHEAGEYIYTFNASGLHSGVYFYRLTAGSSVQTKRMILVK